MAISREVGLPAASPEQAKSRTFRTITADALGAFPRYSATAGQGVEPQLEYFSAPGCKHAANLLESGGLEIESQLQLRGSLDDRVDPTKPAASRRGRPDLSARRRPGRSSTALRAGFSRRSDA